MATVRAEDYQAVQHDLGRSLRSLRTDCSPIETARILLSYDGPGQPLVGVRYDGRRAVYYDETGRRAIGVFFDAEGLDRRAGLPIASLPDGVSLEGWVERMRSYWGWRHPRYR